VGGASAQAPGVGSRGRRPSTARGVARAVIAAATLVLFATTLAAADGVGGAGGAKQERLSLQLAADGSVVEALRVLGIKRPAVATSYLPDIDARLGEVLQQSGFLVPAIRGMGLKRSIDMGKVLPDATYRLAHAVARAAADADGIFISCGNLRSFEAIEPLEKDTGLPVVTSNQAGLWQALRMAGVQQQLPNLGRLLREH